MQRYVPTDDYRAALARARLRARTDDADANEQEYEALGAAADTLEPDPRLTGTAASVATRQRDQLRERAVALDSGDLRFRSEADSLWDDVQDYAFRMGAEPPARFVLAPVAEDDGPGDTLGARMAYDRRQTRAAGRAPAPVDHRALAAFALRDLMRQPPARSAFHRRLQTQNLLGAASLAGAAPPAKPSPTKASSSAPASAATAASQAGSQAGGRSPGRGTKGAAQAAPRPDPRFDEAAAEDDEERERSADTLEEALRRASRGRRWDGPEGVEVTEVIEAEGADDVEDGQGAGEDIGSLIPRALPDVDAAEVDDLVSAFREAGVDTRGAAADLASDRSVARESGDALRLGVGARLGLDRDESYARLRDRGRFIAIARTARPDPDAA